MAKLLDSLAAKRRRWEEDKRLEQEFLNDQYPHDAGYTKDGGKIGWTQHQHVVAMSVAARVAVKMGVNLTKEGDGVYAQWNAYKGDQD
ncbi:hypothetical protein O181_104238 [Austropuccinia psidii MF-1]|uniref:Uncharacterized protein n=1 Tax=Austropuccinia psidii MF-1 TaxID=1389203 RepID=A0A9Q3JLV6_9BASI|nr:hypothetical protein [Austropuccinia psidii MF-1]